MFLFKFQRFRFETPTQTKTVEKIIVFLKLSLFFFSSNLCFRTSISTTFFGVSEMIDVLLKLSVLIN